MNQPGEILRNKLRNLNWISGRELLVGLDDHLHEIVTDDIFVGEIYKFDSLNIGQNPFGFDESAAFSGRQIDLSYVTRNNCF